MSAKAGTAHLGVDRHRKLLQDPCAATLMSEYNTDVCQEGRYDHHFVIVLEIEHRRETNPKSFPDRKPRVTSGRCQLAGSPPKVLSFV